MKFLRNKKTITSLIIVIYILVVLGQGIYNKFERIRRDKLGNKRYTYMLACKYNIDNLKLYDDTKELKASCKKLNENINKELEETNKYKKAMMIFSNYAIDEKAINESYMNIEAQERMLKKVSNLEELKTQLNNCEDLNKFLRETIFSICKKEDNNAYLNRAILEEDWRLVEDLFFKGIIGEKNESYMAYEVNSFGETVIKKHKDSKRYYNNIYLNAINLNDELRVNLSVALKEKINNKYAHSLEKCKEFKTYYLDRNCIQDKSLEEKDYIEQIESIVNLAKNNKELLDDIHIHMLEQIEEALV